MIDGPRANLVRALRERFSYSPAVADTIATELRALPRELRTAATRYLWSGDVQADGVGAYDAPRLIDEFDMVPIAAFLTLGWLIREPAQMKQAMAEYRSFTIIKAPFVNTIRLRSLTFDLAALAMMFDRLGMASDEVYEPVLRAALSIFSAFETRMTLAIDANDLGELLSVMAAVQNTTVPLSLYGLENRFVEWRAVGAGIYNRLLSEATIQKRSIESGINTVAGILLTKHGVDRRASIDQARNLMSLSPALQSDLSRFWENGELPTTEIDGHTVSSIRETDGLDVITAFLKLDCIGRQKEISNHGPLRRLRSLGATPNSWPRSPKVNAYAE